MARTHQSPGRPATRVSIGPGVSVSGGAAQLYQALRTRPDLSEATNEELGTLLGRGPLSAVLYLRELERTGLINRVFVLVGNAVTRQIEIQE